MKKTTLCFLIDNDKILLAMKKRGFGVGKWNGVGGKLQEGEGPEQAIIRETSEEIGVKIEKDNLEKVASIQFYFPEKPDWNQECHVYIARSWNDNPIETEEMKPRWYLFKDIPYKEMWVDDIYWLPKVLDGKKITAEFHFANNGEKFDKWNVKEVN